jgi:hypothetical protein
MTKKRRAELVKEGKLNKRRWDRPTLPPLTGDDKHLYYPMLPADRR